MTPDFGTRLASFSVPLVFHCGDRLLTIQLQMLHNQWAYLVEYLELEQGRKVGRQQESHLKIHERPVVWEFDSLVAVFADFFRSTSSNRRRPGVYVIREPCHQLTVDDDGMIAAADAVALDSEDVDEEQSEMVVVSRPIVVTRLDDVPIGANDDVDDEMLRLADAVPMDEADDGGDERQRRLLLTDAPVLWV